MTREESLSWLKAEKEKINIALKYSMSTEQRERLSLLKEAIDLAIDRIRKRKKAGDVWETLADCYSVKRTINA